MSHSKNNHVVLTKLQYHSSIEKEADSKKAKHANKKQEIKEREVFSPGNLNHLSGTQISRFYPHRTITPFLCLNYKGTNYIVMLYFYS